MDQKILSRIKNYYTNLKPIHRKKLVAFVVAFLVALFLAFFVSAPTSFPTGDIVTIESGQSLQEVTQMLYQKNIIRSPLIFRSTAILLGGEKKLIAGDYLLPEKETSVWLAFRIVRGMFDIPNIRLTIPEGWNVFQMADYFQKNLQNFDRMSFLAEAIPKEGYLFPETYFVPPTIQAKNLIQRMQNNFQMEIRKIPEIVKFNKSLSDIVTMASILEEEALPKDRQMVAGILWKRIALGMPLQVDSPFVIILGKNTYQLTTKDLQTDSPYNTYKYKGLPPGPISNPGADALRATVTPIDSPYLYFLTSRDGTIHYAKTYSEHLKNKARYL